MGRAWAGVGLLVGLLVGVLLVASGCGLAPTTTPGPPAPSSRATPGPGSAGTALDRLVIAPDGPVTGYDREAFGTWLRTAPGCDTRDVVLARDLTDTTVRHGCDVVAGTLHSPYTGRTVTGSTRTVQIDHRVPLALAWRTGAAAWTRAQRVAFANDPAELVAVEGAGNEGKGDEGPEAWAPGVDGCGYSRSFVAVAVKYRLTVSPARAAALRRLEATCRT
jgi:hypothetical protein